MVPNFLEILRTPLALSKKDNVGKISHLHLSNALKDHKNMIFCDLILVLLFPEKGAKITYFVNLF